MLLGDGPTGEVAVVVVAAVVADGWKEFESTESSPTEADVEPTGVRAINCVGAGDGAGGA